MPVFEETGTDKTVDIILDTISRLVGFTMGLLMFLSGIFALIFYLKFH